MYVEGKKFSLLLLVEFSYLGHWLLHSPDTWLEVAILGPEAFKSLGPLLTLSK